MARLLRRLLGEDDHGLFAGSSARRLPYAAVAIPLFLAHLALSQLGWTLLSGTTLTPVWPSSGLDLVALLIFGPRFWPVLFAAYFVTTSGRAVAWAPALGMSFANSLRPLIGVWLFHSISKRKFLGDFGEAAAITGTALLSPMLPAALGTAILILGGTFQPSQWQVVSSRWWIKMPAGTVVELLRPDVYEVEFLDSKGHTRTIRPIAHAGGKATRLGRRDSFAESAAE